MRVRYLTLAFPLPCPSLHIHPVYFPLSFPILLSSLLPFHPSPPTPLLPSFLFPSSPLTLISSHYIGGRLLRLMLRSGALRSTDSELVQASIKGLTSLFALHNNRLAVRADTRMQMKERQAMREINDMMPDGQCITPHHNHHRYHSTLLHCFNFA